MDYSSLGLHRPPFSAPPSPTDLYVGRTQKNAASALYLAATEHLGPGVLVGSPGLGKTTLLLYLKERLERSGAVVYLQFPFQQPEQLLSAVLYRLGISSEEESEQTSWLRLEDFVSAQQNLNRRLVVMLDEAHLNGPKVLEQFRLLTNLSIDVILGGQTSLRRTLARPEMEALRQRIAVNVELQALTLEETGDYIDHLLAQAGRTAPLFDEEAKKAVHVFSGGVPRRVNRLCLQALNQLWAEQGEIIDRGHIESTQDAFEWEAVGESSIEDEEAATAPVPSN